MRVVVIYDDTGRKSEVISDIIGEKGFADVVVKKRCLEEYYRDEIKKIYPDLIWKKIHSVYEYATLEKELEMWQEADVRVMHCFANYLFSDAGKAALAMKKLAYIDEPYAVLVDKRAVAGMFPHIAAYISFCKNILSGKKAWDAVRAMKESFQIEGMVDIGIVENFIQCITGDFDSRYFNSVKGNEYTLVKSSVNKKKIKAEYNYYHLLPDDMKYWFVIPFHYTETEDSASYTMEHLHMADLAVKWVHGSMGESEFESLMDKYFYFFMSRHVKECSKEEYLQVAKALYEDKVNNRIAELKSLPKFKQIEALLTATNEISLDGLVVKYYELKKSIEAKVNYPSRLVIGHGDPCFANALYNKSTKTLKFIDPKGANTEEELWTNPYYDIAKLSHSVCGDYDFFNNGLFDIKVNTGLSYSLEIPFDHSVYQRIFKRVLEENGFDYLTVRIYEVSLFLSMLPLHIDNPQKVLGFILNARKILEEIEKNV